MKPFKTLSAGVVVNKLFAVVRYVRNDKNPKKGGTQIEVRHGTLADFVVLGSATIGGRWSQDQALVEFRKNPKRFGWDKPVPATSSDLAVALGPMAVASFTGAEGEYTPASALAFFLANAGRFEKAPGFDLAVRLGLVPVAAVA